VDSTQETKVCRLCAETIPAAAKVCSHCRHWQRTLSIHNPQVLGAIFAFLVFVGLVCLAITLNAKLQQKEEFTAYRDQLSVLSSSLSFRTSAGSNLLVAVVGTLTNQSKVGWKNVSVEARFFDKSGNLIDAMRQHRHPALIRIGGDGEAAIKLEGKAVRPQSDYDTHKAYVRSAKDAASWL
jgi:hypothetical protein